MPIHDSESNSIKLLGKLFNGIVFKIEFKTNLKFYFVSYNAKNNILSLLHSKIAVF